MKRVLIISYYWAPMGGSDVRRWLKFAKYLPENGWQPVIYTPSNPNFELKDETLLKEIPKECEVIKQSIWEPYQFTSFFSSKKRSRLADSFRKDEAQSHLEKFLNYVRSNYFVPDTRVYWVKKSIKFLTKYLAENPVDAIVSNGSPHSMHLIGLGLKKNLGLKWLADFRDPWTKNDFYNTLSLSKGSDAKHKRLEKEVVSKADAVTVAWDAIKSDYAAYNENVAVITNGYDQANFVAGSPRMDERFSISHTGLLNADCNPKKLWKVLEKIGREQHGFLNDLEIKLVGNVEPSIVAAIEEAGLSKQLNLVGSVPNSDLHGLQKTSQLLLLVLSDTPAARGMVVDDLFECLKAGRPILAVCPEDGSLAKIIADTKTGASFGYDDEVRLEQHVLECYAAFKKGELYVDGEGIDKYSRRNLTRDLVRILEGM